MGCHVPFEYPSARLSLLLLEHRRRRVRLGLRELQRQRGSRLLRRPAGRRLRPQLLLQKNTIGTFRETDLGVQLPSPWGGVKQRWILLCGRGENRRLFLPQGRGVDGGATRS